ncbi:hypothetical protein D9757_007563 [Collybiopsis confluens]|uniref:Actin-like ATPase domain-containing protein n=1 Tax=Collybiopsis confluens TaxID=2823264 RepID=A0A8H5M5Z2_9AGAR|nr:hypothetical protein D9757_007563 [Collybiopsis confluens]
MSCCGEAREPGEGQNRPVNAGQPTGYYQQPGPMAPMQQQLGGLEKNYQSPSPPPAIYASPFPPPNEPLHPQQPSWNSQSSTPPPLQPFTPLPGSPPPGSFSFNNGIGDTIARPSSAFTVGSNIHGANLSLSRSPPPMPPVQNVIPVMNEGKMSVSIDFGTTFSGVAYGSSRINGGQVQQILSWPGAVETYRKIPTCLLYDEHGQILAWGLEAKHIALPNAYRCEWFKLFLEPRALRDSSTIDPRLPKLPPGKNAVDLIIDFLGCLWEYAKEQITREIDSADVWLTVPAAWDAKGCDLMREAAIQAGLVQSSRAGDTQWRDRLRIITEPEAAAVHCAQLTALHHLQPSQNFIVCDAGGGTVDLAVYKIIGQMANLEIAEIAARSGANCGSLFLDLRFRELVRTLLADHPAHLDPASLAYFMHSFSETEKLDYAGVHDDDNMFHFTCFNVDDPDDPTVGLVDGQLTIPGALLRREVFDPVVEQVLALIEEQLSKVDNQRVDALLLVGGFAGSEYLKQRVEEQLKPRIRVIARPSDADTATLRGAAKYGLARRALVSSVIAPRSYIMKVKLPAEPEDWQKRPAYIRNNDAGHPVCENRLQYLVQKGAIIRKGQRLTTKFCKFSQTVQDSSFVAVLYTSESDKIMRYNDEGETVELCKWTVDLSSLPAFQQNALMGQSGGFYTGKRGMVKGDSSHTFFYKEFEIGLELDSAEVRGILLYNNQEWGRQVMIVLSAAKADRHTLIRVTFDFLN